VYDPLADDGVRLVQSTAQTLSIYCLLAYPGPKRRAHFVVAGRASKRCSQFFGGCGSHGFWHPNFGAAATGVEHAIKAEQDCARYKEQYQWFAERFEPGPFLIASRTCTHLSS
jgi:hypothetical protein